MTYTGNQMFVQGRLAFVRRWPIGQIEILEPRLAVLHIYPCLRYRFGAGSIWTNATLLAGARGRRGDGNFRRCM
jgi:hypothetical protein